MEVWYGLLAHPFMVVVIEYCKVTGPDVRLFAVPFKFNCGGLILPEVVVETPVGKGFGADKVQLKLAGGELMLGIKGILKGTPEQTAFI